VVSISVAVAPAAGRLLTRAVVRVCRVTLFVTVLKAIRLVRFVSKLEKFAGKDATRALD
jgi:hypothetical protein